MEKIHLTFLGTSDAIPTTKRSHPAILITYKNENILVDCGEGTQRQFKFAGLNPCKLTKLLITHWHGDHVLGIPGLLQTLGMLGYNRTLEIFGPKGTKKKIDLLQSLFKLSINIKINEVLDSSFYEDKEIKLETKSMNHNIMTNAYSFILKDKRRLDINKLKKYSLPNSPLLKKLQEGKNIKHNGKIIKVNKVSYIEKMKKVSIVLDTLMNTKAINLAKDSDLLICEATFSIKDNEQAKLKKHLTAYEAGMIAKKANVKKLILTHISQRYQTKIRNILTQAKSIFKNVEIAEDFDSLTL